MVRFVLSFFLLISLLGSAIASTEKSELSGTSPLVVPQYQLVDSYPMGNLKLLLVGPTSTLSWNDKTLIGKFISSDGRETKKAFTLIIPKHGQGPSPTCSIKKILPVFHEKVTYIFYLMHDSATENGFVSFAMIEEFPIEDTPMLAFPFPIWDIYFSAGKLHVVCNMERNQYMFSEFNVIDRKFSLVQKRVATVDLKAKSNSLVLSVKPGFVSPVQFSPEVQLDGKTYSEVSCLNDGPFYWNASGIFSPKTDDSVVGSEEAQPMTEIIKLTEGQTLTKVLVCSSQNSHFLVYLVVDKNEKKCLLYSFNVATNELKLLMSRIIYDVTIVNNVCVIFSSLNNVNQFSSLSLANSSEGKLEFTKGDGDSKYCRELSQLISFGRINFSNPSLISALPIKERITIFTHDSIYHIDEMLAVVMLRVLDQFKNAPLRRISRDQIQTPDKRPENYMYIDIGSVYDFKKLSFDHHHVSFQGTLEGKDTKLSSAGLIVRHYGEAILRSLWAQRYNAYNMTDQEIKEFTKHFYEKYIEELDMIDNGQTTPVNVNEAFVNQLAALFNENGLNPLHGDAMKKDIREYFDTAPFKGVKYDTSFPTSFININRQIESMSAQASGTNYKEALVILDRYFLESFDQAAKEFTQFSSPAVTAF